MALLKKSLSSNSDMKPEIISSISLYFCSSMEGLRAEPFGCVGGKEGGGGSCEPPVEARPRGLGAMSGPGAGTAAGLGFVRTGGGELRVCEGGLSGGGGGGKLSASTISAASLTETDFMTSAGGAGCEQRGRERHTRMRLTRIYDRQKHQCLFSVWMHSRSSLRLCFSISVPMLHSCTGKINQGGMYLDLPNYDRSSHLGHKMDTSHWLTLLFTFHQRKAH